ncbi:Hypothetical protein PBC10988_30960 [Planctomycetales bacterium 10988]|nr:Hypothetical protein PBC10988_30960 [Planctomycetales bacterium 10988]
MWSDFFSPKNRVTTDKQLDTPLQLEQLEGRQLLAAMPVLIDIVPGADGSGPGNFEEMNGTVFFAANDGTNGVELWKSDGTSAGTQMVKNINTGPAGANPELSSNPRALQNVNGTLFFGANDGSNGFELWKSDGTSAGTVLVKDINPGSSSSFVNFTENLNGTLFFSALESSVGYELWKSDGTSAGTVLVKDINPGTLYSRPTDITNVGGTLFFGAIQSSPDIGFELWKSDGTSTGTVLIKDINPDVVNSFTSTYSTPKDFTEVNGTVFFTANDGTAGYELWKTDGTSAGTELVKEILPGSAGPRPTDLENMNGTLFFAANDGTNGTELWMSDGTSAGTMLVKDINPTISSYPSSLENVNNTLWFAANDGTNGTELWRSYGTSGGTTLAFDLNMSGSSSPKGMTNINGTLFFAANDGSNGNELWVLTEDPDEPFFVTGSDDGSGRVLVLDGDGADQYFLFPYSQAFTGGVRVATGDINGDGNMQIVTAAGPGGGPRIRVFDLEDGSVSSGALVDFYAYDPAFTGGVFVAVADVNDDGFDDIITGADAGGGPHVRVFSGQDGSMLSEFYAYDVNFSGGVRVAAGDINDDGFAEVITAPGAGGGPHIRVFDGNVSNSFPIMGPATDFYAYDPAFLGGVFVASGDVNNDGFDDIITGADAGGGPHVRGFSSDDGSMLHDFYAYDPSFTGGVRVASFDYNDDGYDDIITAPGPVSGPAVRVFSGMDSSLLTSFFAGDSQIQFGIFVTGGFGTLPDVPFPTSAPFSSFFVSEDSDPPEEVNVESPTAKKSWVDDTEEFYQSAEEIDKLFSGLGI